MRAKPHHPPIDETAERLFREAVARQGIDLEAPGDPRILAPLARMVQDGLDRTRRLTECAVAA